MLPDSEVLDPLFVRHGVRFAYLFGSRARQRETATSDVDIACWYRLLFPRPADDVVRFEARIRQRCEDYAYSQRFFTRAMRQRLAVG